MALYLATAQASVPGLAQDLGGVAGLKQQSEDWAIRIKADFPPSTRQRSDHFNTAFKKYSDASAAFNAWLTEMRYRIVNRQPRMSAQYREGLQHAARLATDFLSYAEDMYGQRGGPSLGPMLPQIAAVLIELASKVWDRYQALPDSDRDALVRELDRLKWRSFDEL